VRKNSTSLFKKIKLLLVDVDGVLTRGEIVYDDSGRELKFFNVKYGLGLVLLSKIGIKTAIVTAKDGAFIHRRAKDMCISEVVAGIVPKESVLDGLIQRHGVKRGEVCFIGDDIIDIGLLSRVGVGVAVADAVGAVKRRAKYITKSKGGEGAVREVIDLIIVAHRLEKKVLAWVKNPTWR